MKRFFLLPLLALLVLAFNACEKHPESHLKAFEHHKDHGAHGEAAHGDAHAKPAADAHH